MDCIECVGAIQKVGRTLRGATDAAQFRYTLGLDSHFKQGIDDPLGNGIVAATRTQRALAASVVEHRKSQAIAFWCGWCGGHYFPSMETISSVTDRASIGSPSSRATLRSFGTSSLSRSIFKRLNTCPSRFCSTTYTRLCDRTKSAISCAKGYARIRKQSVASLCSSRN